MTLIAPQVTSLWWERARLEQSLGHNQAARASLTAMLETTHAPALTRRIHAALAALSSRYVQVDELPWQATRFPGIHIKVLMEDTATGLQTVLTRMAPGATLTDHEIGRAHV